MAYLEEHRDGEQFGIVNNIQSFESTLNGYKSFTELPGSRWAGVFTFSNRTGMAARRLVAFLLGLRGQLGTFEITPSDCKQLGTMSGAGVVNGADQTGSSLATKGWTANQAKLFYAGDYIEVNQELKMVLADAASDASGNATLSIAPPLRKSPSDGQDIIVTNPKCYMRLTSPVTDWQLGPNVYTTSISAEEVV